MRQQNLDRSATKEEQMDVLVVLRELDAEASAAGGGARLPEIKKIKKSEKNL